MTCTHAKPCTAWHSGTCVCMDPLSSQQPGVCPHPLLHTQTHARAHACSCLPRTSTLLMRQCTHVPLPAHTSTLLMHQCTRVPLPALTSTLLMCQCTCVLLPASIPTLLMCLCTRVLLPALTSTLLMRLCTRVLLPAGTSTLLMRLCSRACVCTCSRPMSAPVCVTTDSHAHVWSQANPCLQTSTLEGWGTERRQRALLLPLCNPLEKLLGPAGRPGGCRLWAPSGGLSCEAL